MLNFPNLDCEIKKIQHMWNKNSMIFYYKEKLKT
jgi:hypothetical protein